jgi:phosphate transport system substrate-binding protein
VKIMKVTANSLAIAPLIGILSLSSGYVAIADWMAQAQAPQQTIKIDGSSTVFPITDEIAKEYKLNSTDQPKIQVSISGTGGGFKKFCQGQTDLNNASRPILKEEMKACKAAGVEYIELPIAYDALTIVVNPKNTWANDITVAELKKIWEPTAEGKITRWNQIRPHYPNQPLKLYGADKESGTFDYFTEAIVGKAKASRNDYTASDDDLKLVQGVKQDPNALAYFGHAYYEENQKTLKALPVDNGKGAIEPTRENVRNAQYQPLSRPLFIYVNAKAAKRSHVKQFVEFYLSNARQYVKTVGYVPLPDEIYDLAGTRFVNNKVGTVFAGQSQIGLNMEDLLNREAGL